MDKVSKINNLDVQTRFWKKVKILEDNECWEWQAGKNYKGYGEFYVAGERHLHAHQISWIHRNDEIPEGMCVLHRCDNPSCVNPNHLFLGTNQDNVTDKMNKGRWKSHFLVGEEHPQHGTNSKFNKLSEQDVKDIREKYKAGQTLRSIAKEFGVVHGVINNIIQGRKWSWLK